MFVTSGRLEGPDDIVMSALNHLVTKSAITLTAKEKAVVLVISADKAKEIYEDAKDKLSTDVKAFSIKNFKVMKMIGSGS